MQLPPTRTAAATLPLGGTSARVSPLVVGTSGLGRGTAPGSGEETRAVDLARAMLASGLHIDTANEYAEGRSEMILGLALAAQQDAAPRVITKVDRDPVTGAFDRDRVMRSYEESLHRLGVDRVSTLFLHDPYTVSVDDVVGPGGALAGLRALRNSGAVDAIGIAAGPIPLLARYIDTGEFDVVLSHNRFTLVDSSARPLFERARARGMGVINAAPFGAGILATGPRPEATYAYRAASAALQSWVSRVEAICRSFATTLPAIALAFSLRSSLVDATVVGVSSVERLAALRDLVAVATPDGVWAELEALGPAPSPIDDAPAGAR